MGLQSSLEIDHPPQHRPASRNGKGLEDDLVEVLGQQGSPGLKAAGVVAAISERQSAGDSATLGELEVNDVDVPVVADGCSETSEERRDGLVVEVMEETVDEDEVV